MSHRKSHSKHRKSHGKSHGKHRKSRRKHCKRSHRQEKPVCKPINCVYFPRLPGQGGQGGSQGQVLFTQTQSFTSFGPVALSIVGPGQGSLGPFPQPIELGDTYTYITSGVCEWGVVQQVELGVRVRSSTVTVPESDNFNIISQVFTQPTMQFTLTITFVFGQTGCDVGMLFVWNQNPGDTKKGIALIDGAYIGSQNLTFDVAVFANGGTTTTQTGVLTKVN